MALSFLSYADQGMYLAHTAGGQQAVIQLLWRYNRTVDLDALAQFRNNLAHGELARLIRPAYFPFGRHQWVATDKAALQRNLSADPLAPEAKEAWMDAQVEQPLDPVSGPAWTFSVQSFKDGATLVSLVVSHTVADGTATVTAVSRAVRGEMGVRSSPARSGRRTPRDIIAELAQTVRDTPRTFPALLRLVKMASSMRKPATMSAAGQPAGGKKAQFASVYVRVPIASWDARARNLGTNRFTLLTAVTAAFSEALCRVKQNTVTLLIPVRRRDQHRDGAANQVLLTSVKIPIGEAREDLRTMQNRLSSALRRALREENELARLMPLVPFVPKKAFSRAGIMAFGALSDLPTTCSHMGDLPMELLRIDGAQADRFCFRGIDRQVDLLSMESRQGVATLLAGALPGYLLLNFVACQPGLITDSRQLRELVARLLAPHNLTIEFFDE